MLHQPLMMGVCGPSQVRQWTDKSLASCQTRDSRDTVFFAVHFAQQQRAKALCAALLLFLF